MERFSSSLLPENQKQTEETNDSGIKKTEEETIHEHPLRLRSNGGNEICGMCELQINGQAYACDDCHHFWVHERCAELPRTLHPLHKLHLVKEAAFNLFICDICGDASKGFNFYCRSCDFVIDVKCAFMSKAGQSFYDRHGGETLKHPLHRQHKLTLANFRADSLAREWCEVCGELLLGPSYCCRVCGFRGYFHKACMQWPSSVEGHPTAPHHLLQLGEMDFWGIWNDGGRVPPCFACGDTIISRFGYKVVDLERGIFWYHIECGSSLAHPLRRGGLHHLFYYLHNKPSKGAFAVAEDTIHRCASCREEAMNSYYRCRECGLYYHFGCLRGAKWLPSTARHEQHMHRLSLKEECTDYGGYYCDICEEPRDSRHPCYACDDCEFVVHIECIVSEENASSVTLEEIEGDDVVRIQECGTNS
ncbi:PREDICTED: uncharacterized protein LOC104813282 [Tarenaya hassleriana]|uniref:uncharacterized protein LOC104813282 n=1 Tax=Tarenaya hassleriana TaxID=28532 RepID=UPI0008FD3B68|nr:PREDICTED: uncharacterized protein LOC104813282 [Tarenaya hassleriana]